MRESVRAAVLVTVLTLALSAAARAQSCAAADSVLGPTKSKVQLKSSYDKFADSSSLESKSQGFVFLYRANIKLTFVAKHAGTTDRPLITQMHLNAMRLLQGNAQVAQTPDAFPDSTQAIIVTDSGRIVLKGAGHRATRMQNNVVSGPTIEEDLWFPMTAEQIAQIARTRSGGIRVGEFDMPMQQKFAESASAVYRAAVCTNN